MVRRNTQSFVIPQNPLTSPGMSFFGAASEASADGSYAHHLLDPSSGSPVWSGLIAATALAPTALEADVLAKAALLSGPAGAPRFLARHGGLVVRDDGSVEGYGPLEAEAAERGPGARR